MFPVAPKNRTSRLGPYLSVVFASHGNVLIDIWIAQRMFLLNLHLGFKNEDPYPHVLDTNGASVARLHVWVHDAAVSDGLRRPLRAGNEIHHRNEQKLDARLHNLEQLPPEIHRKVHRRRRAAKRRKRQWLGGFYRPRTPGPVTRPALAPGEETLRGLDAPKNHIQPPSQRLERCLREWLPYVRCAVGWRCSGAPIPRAPRGWKNAQRMGIHSPRLALTDAESALVGYLAAHSSDLVAVVSSFATALALPDEQVEGHLRAMMRRPAVDQALSRWREHRRLPKHLSWYWRRPSEVPDPPHSHWRKTRSGWWRWSVVPSKQE